MKTCAKERTLRLLFVFCILSSSLAWADIDVGNGGDVLECRAEAGARFVGAYAFDYLISYNYANNNIDVDPVAGDEPLARMIQILSAKYPTMGLSLARFWRDASEQIRFDRRHDAEDWQRELVWENAGRLNDLPDEWRRSSGSPIPENCCTQDACIFSSIQAVVQKKQAASIVYTYDPTTLQKLQLRPLQYSFLMVHEWLWRFSRNPEAVSAANRFLHSSALEGTSPSELPAVLSRLGVDFDARTNAPRKIVRIMGRQAPGEGEFTPPILSVEPSAIQNDAAQGTRIFVINRAYIPFLVSSDDGSLPSQYIDGDPYTPGSMFFVPPGQSLKLNFCSAFPLNAAACDRIRPNHIFLSISAN